MGSRQRKGRRGCNGARARALRLLLASVLAWAPSACGKISPPDILLISVDTLRADRLGCYGSERETSPEIDRLAASGARFATVVAPTSWTLPSHVTLLTGLSIRAHRVATSRDRLDPNRRTLAEHLVERGYRAAAFVSAPFLHRSYGFDRGFEVYRNLGTDFDTSTGPLDGKLQQRSHSDQTAARVVEAASEWLEETCAASDEPLFLFVHLWDPHYDYIPPPPYDGLFDPDYAGDLDPRDYARNREIHAGMPPRDLEHLRALYDGEIRWTDIQVGRLLSALERAGRSGASIVALVSDHGEEFFEHGNKGHTKTLFDESLLVPWLVRYPRTVRPGTSIRDVASLEDVAPTLLDLAELPPLPETTGTSRVPELVGREGAGRPALAEFAGQAALRGLDWKVVRRPGGSAFYYDLSKDPGERDPLSARVSAPDLLATLDERLAVDEGRAASWRWEEREATILDAATRERLRALGYDVSETEEW